MWFKVFPKASGSVEGQDGLRSQTACQSFIPSSVAYWLHDLRRVSSYLGNSVCSSVKWGTRIVIAS